MEDLCSSVDPDDSRSFRGVKCTFRFETSFADAEDEAGTLVSL